MRSNVCLVLNNAYQPLGGITEEEAICLVVQDKAKIIKDDRSKPYRSKYLSLFAPKVVILGHYVRPRSFQFKAEKLTNTNLFRRDGYICQYCGRNKKQLRHNEKLTRDHIEPISRGGIDFWDNVVTSCSTCNLSKADQTLKEADMKVLNKPQIPITWVIRGKAKLTEEQLIFAEEVLNIKTIRNTKYVDFE